MSKKRKFKLFTSASIFFITLGLSLSSPRAQTESPSSHDRSQPSTGSVSDSNEKGGKSDSSFSRQRNSQKKSNQIKSKNSKYYKAKRSSNNSNSGFINDRTGTYENQ